MAWTDITREQHKRAGLRYPSDLTDAEWALIAPLLPPARRGGRPRTTDLREVVNAILYLASSGCQWRMLPKDFPPLSTVQGYFYDWRNMGLWQSINHLLVVGFYLMNLGWVSLSLRFGDRRSLFGKAGAISAPSLIYYKSQ